MSDSPEDNATRRKITEALEVLRQLGFPRAQQNERSALTLLALLKLRPEMKWAQAEAPLCGITPIMQFISAYYDRTYAPNTRETVRRQTVHQFLQAGLVVANPDNPSRPTNSPASVYQITQEALKTLRRFGTRSWERALVNYLESVGLLSDKYSQPRTMTRIPLQFAPGKSITLSPGGQNVLIAKILDEFAPRFVPGGTPLYIGDAENKSAFFDKEELEGLGVVLDPHGKVPDVIIHDVERGWLLLIEAVTSHGPIDPKRQTELRVLFQGSKLGLVFVTAFPTRKILLSFLQQLAWETEVWVAESPDHLIHFNGERYLGPF